MRVLTSAEMSETDRRTVQDFGIPLMTLMEAAGKAVAAFAKTTVSDRPANRCVVWKRQSTEGDGMVAARLLASSGLAVKVVLLGKGEAVKGDAASALTRLREANVTLHEVRGRSWTAERI